MKKKYYYYYYYYYYFGHTNNTLHLQFITIISNYKY